MKVVATTAHKPTDTDFTASVAKLREAKGRWVPVAGKPLGY